MHTFQNMISGTLLAPVFQIRGHQCVIALFTTVITDCICASPQLTIKRVRGLTSIIPTVGKRRQENWEFETSQGYIIKLISNLFPVLQFVPSATVCWEGSERPLSHVCRALQNGVSSLQRTDRWLTLCPMLDKRSHYWKPTGDPHQNLTASTLALYPASKTMRNKCLQAQPRNLG